MTAIACINRSGHPLAPARAGDAGVDLRACTAAPQELAPGTRWVVRTGISLAIPAGYVGLVLPRSGLARDHGVAAVTGVIDSGFRGELAVVLANQGQAHYTVEPGDRVAQLVIVPCVTARFVDVEQLPASERGTNGFGSTGRGGAA